MKRKLKRKFAQKLKNFSMRANRHVALCHQRYFWGNNTLHRNVSLDTAVTHSTTGIIWVNVYLSSLVAKSRVVHRKTTSARAFPHWWMSMACKSYRDDMVPFLGNILKVQQHEKKTKA